MSELNTKIVRYDLWCTICKHRKVKETDEPCDTCLTESVRYGTRMPSKFEGLGEGRGGALSGRTGKQ